MLQLFKNQVVTDAAKQQVQIRKLELDWYTDNYWTLSQQGALLAGFAFTQITSSVPDSTPPLLETTYVILSTLSMGLQLSVILITTFCCMWGPGLALRGPSGSRSVHQAVDQLKIEQMSVYFLFVVGLVSFYITNILRLWCFFEDWVALSSTIILSVFLFLIIYYAVYLTVKLRVEDEDAVCGKIEALKAYEEIVDLDGMYGGVLNQRMREEGGVVGGGDHRLGGEGEGADHHFPGEELRGVGFSRGGAWRGEGVEGFYTALGAEYREASQDEKHRWRNWVGGGGGGKGSEYLPLLGGGEQYAHTAGTRKEAHTRGGVGSLQLIEDGGRGGRNDEEERSEDGGTPQSFLNSIFNAFEAFGGGGEG